MIKCKDCALLDKCPSGQRCVEMIEDFERYCPFGFIDEHKKRSDSNAEIQN